MKNGSQPAVADTQAAALLCENRPQHNVTMRHGPFMRPSLLRASPMRTSWAYPAGSPFSTQIRPALTSVADDICATVARLFAYLGTLALVATLTVHFFEQLPDLAVFGASSPSWNT